MRYSLALVMPVYNEEACIEAVVNAWRAALSSLEIDFQMIILNDGSRDSTATQLARIEGDAGIKIINKKNSGHGPTILEGYRLAVEQAEWVFQVDSDDEMDAKYFESLWNLRQGYAALLGYRSGRQQNAGRRLISIISRAAVRLLFGSGIVDVNTPYRLMRTSALAPMIAQIPADTFAPNILISGMFASSGLPVVNLPVPHEGRKSGTVSIVKWRLWKAAIRSLWQTICFGLRRIKVVTP